MPPRRAENNRTGDGSHQLQSRLPRDRTADTADWEQVLLAKLDESRGRAARALRQLEEERRAETEVLRDACQRLRPELSTAWERLETTQSEAERLRLRVESLEEVIGQRDRAASVVQTQMEELIRLRAASAEEAERAAGEATLWRTRYESGQSRLAEEVLLREACERLTREAEELLRERDAIHGLAAALGRERDEFAARCRQSDARVDELTTRLAQAGEAEAALTQMGRLQREELEQVRRELISTQEQAGGANRLFAEAETRIGGFEVQIERLRQLAEAGRSEYMAALEDQRESANLERRHWEEASLAARLEHQRATGELQQQAAALEKIALELRQERDEAVGRAETVGRERDELVARLEEIELSLEAAERDRGEAGQFLEDLARAREAQEATARDADEMSERLRDLLGDLERARLEADSTRAELNLTLSMHREQLEGERCRHQEMIRTAQQIADREMSELHAHAARLSQEVEELNRDRAQLVQLQSVAGPWQPRRAPVISETGDGPSGRKILEPQDRQADLEASVDHLFERTLFRDEGAVGKRARDGNDSVLDLALERISDQRQLASAPHDNLEVDGESQLPVACPARGTLPIKPVISPVIRDGAVDGPEAGLDRLKGEVERLRDLGQLAEAITMAERVANLINASEGEHHPDFADALLVLASLFYEQGGLDQAVGLQLRAEVVFRGTLGEGHPAYLICLCELAQTQEARGDAERARRLYQRAAPLAIERCGEHHPVSQHIMGRLMALGGSWDPLALLQGAICAGAGPARRAGVLAS